VLETLYAVLLVLVSLTVAGCSGVVVWKLYQGQD
jgi:hypothetical protein